MKDVDTSSELSTGAIIGIVVGGVCILGLCAASACYFLIGNNKQRGFNNRPYENQMGAVQAGPNFDAGDDTMDNYPYNANTFNTTVTNE